MQISSVARLVYALNKIGSLRVVRKIFLLSVALASALLQTEKNAGPKAGVLGGSRVVWF